MEGSLKGRKNKQDEASLTIVPRAGVNQTLFRILVKLALYCINIKETASLY